VTAHEHATIFSACLLFSQKFVFTVQDFLIVLHFPSSVLYELKGRVDISYLRSFVLLIEACILSGGVIVPLIRTKAGDSTCVCVRARTLAAKERLTCVCVCVCVGTLAARKSDSRAG
jgi:hypothetical protein